MSTEVGKKQCIKKNVLRILFFIILSFCYIYFFTNSTGQAIIKANIDGEFHISRILSLENIFNSPVNFKYFAHTGQIVNLMYPWVLVYPMYLLYKLTNDVVLAYYLYFTIITFVTLELTYYCSKKMKQSTLGAMLVAVLYSFSMVRTSDIYFRMAIGEVLGITFFPLVLLGIYQIFYEKKPKWIALTLGMTLLVYSHVISVVLASLLILMFFFINILRKKINKERLLALLKATGMTLLLGLGFLLPMLQMLISVDISKPVVYNLFQAALKPNDLISKSISNEVSSVITFNFVYIVLIVILLFNLKKIKGFCRDTLLLGTIFTIMSTTLFPWDVFQNLLHVIQFPWRLIGIASLLLAFSFGSLFGNFVNQSHHNKKRLQLFAMTICCIVLCHFGTLDMIGNINGLNNGDTSEKFVKEVSKNPNFNGLDDYAPKDAGYDLQFIHDQKICANASWHSLKIKRTANKVIYKYDSPNATTAFLPVFYYPGEVVKQNGDRIFVQKAQDGATLVNLKEGENTFEVSFEYTKLAKVSWTISLISFVVLCGYLIFKKKRVLAN